MNCATPNDRKKAEAPPIAYGNQWHWFAKYLSIARTPDTNDTLA
jgi:hypothetical protein